MFSFKKNSRQGHLKISNCTAEKYEHCPQYNCNASTFFSTIEIPRQTFFVKSEQSSENLQTQPWHFMEVQKYRWTTIGNTSNLWMESWLNSVPWDVSKHVVGKTLDWQNKLIDYTKKNIVNAACFLVFF